MGGRADSGIRVFGAFPMLFITVFVAAVLSAGLPDLAQAADDGQPSSARASESQLVPATATSLIAQNQYKSLAGATISGVKDATFTGQQITQPGLAVTLDGEMLVEGRDYTVYYSNNYNLGTASIYVNGMGDYIGSTSTTFAISALPIKQTSITLKPSSYVYDGYEKRPSITVSYGGKALDSWLYTVKYSKNTKPGTAKVTITGKGTLEGSVTKTFKIKKKPTLQTSVHQAKGSWTKYKNSGKTAGWNSSSKTLNGLRIRIANPAYSGSVKYRVRVQGKGWQKWTSNGKLAGSAGKGRKIEAIEVKLTGKMAKLFSVNYCVRTENYGWTDWAYNGAPVGTEGLKCGISAVIVELVDKGDERKAYKATYVKHTLSRAKKLLNAASGSNSITVRNGKLAKADKKAIKEYMKVDRVVGFIAVNVKTGKTVAYNPDEAIFSASAIKAPYLAALCKYEAPDIASRESDIRKTLKDSNNETYRDLYWTYGEGYMQKMEREAGVSLSMTSWGYTFLSARDLAKLWAVQHDYLLTGTTNRKLFEQNLLGFEDMFYKAGFMEADSWCGGISTIGGCSGDVLFAVMATHNGSDIPSVSGLAVALIDAVKA